MKKKVRSIFSVAAAISMVCSMQCFAGEYEKSDADAVIDGLSLREHGAQTVMIDDVMYVPLRQTFEMLGKDVFWQEEERTAVVEDTAQGQRFSLIASDTDGQAFLYGLQPQGVILSYRGDASYLPIEYAPQEGSVPKLVCADYDGDGIEEIALKISVGNAQKDAEEALCLLQSDGTEPYIFSTVTFGQAEIADYVKQHMEVSLRGDSLRVVLEQVGKTFSLDYGQAGKPQRVLVGEKAEITISATLFSFRLPISVVCENDTVEAAALTGKIVFSEDGFMITDTQVISVAEETELTQLQQEAKALLERDLQIEQIFNAGLQGDSAYAEACFLIYQQTGQEYFPVISEEYKTVADLKALLESTYSGAERVDHFMDTYVSPAEGAALFKDVDGALYVNMLVGGKGLAIMPDMDSIRVQKLSDTKAEITFGYTFFGTVMGPATTSMTKIDGQWYLDQGVYEVASIA